MAIFKDTTITESGRRLLAKALANGQKITFTKLETSDFDYRETVNIEEVISLNQVKQSINLSSITQEGTFVTVKGVFTNRGLVGSYEIKTIGCFAKINDENEILYSISRVATPDTMPAENGINLSTIEIELVTQINNENGANILYNPNTLITRSNLATEWENNLEKLIGMPYGGTIQGTSSKEAGKFYYDTSTKEYYECTENNTLNYVESSKYRSMSRKNVGKGEIEAWDTTKNSKLSSNDRNSSTYSAYDVGSFEIGNFIIKFGRTSSSIATQYFPTPFPNKCISVVLTPLRRVDIYTNIDVYSYNNQKFTYVGELYKINGICWVAIGY